MFRYRYSLDGDAVQPVKDFEIAPGQENNIKQGTVVKLDANGRVTPATSADTEVLGVSEGPGFEGLGVPFKIAKIRLSANAVYEADFIGAGPLTKGVSYGIDDSSNVDTADTTNTIVKIVDVVNGNPYVVITKRQIV